VGNCHFVLLLGLSSVPRFHSLGISLFGVHHTILHWHLIFVACKIASSTHFCNYHTGFFTAFRWMGFSCRVAYDYTLYFILRMLFYISFLRHLWASFCPIEGSRLARLD
jgi:hypothetical protein